MKAIRRCSFPVLMQSAHSVPELLDLAGVCDQGILWRAAGRAIKSPADQWEKLMALLRERIRQRYVRGELVEAEGLALARWCGEKLKAAA